jgi:hypothetical protein
MEVSEMIILVAVAALAMCTPLGLVVLFSLAIRREDSAGSLQGRPSGSLEAAARRLVGFHTDNLASRSRGRRLAGRRSAGYPGYPGDDTDWTDAAFPQDWANPDHNAPADPANRPDLPHLVG